MTNKSKIAVTLIILTSALTAQAQKGFHFERKLGEIKDEGWYSIFLPDSMYASLRSDFSDLRIYQFKEKDTLEAPYLLKILESANNDAEVTLPMINKSSSNGKQYFTFELSKTQHVNHLDLDFDETNFNGFVQLEGSSDQKQWFTIDSLRRIVSIKRDDVDFKLTTLDFTESAYDFLRLSIKADKMLTIVKASFKKRTADPGLYKKASSRYSTTNKKASKQTILEVTIPMLQLNSRICIATDHSVDFYRPVTIEALRDSIKTPKGWVADYDVVLSSTITSLQNDCFEFPRMLAQKFRITIHNGDNNPLTVRSIDVFGPVAELQARLQPGDNRLFYGNPDADAPSYDIVHFEDKIPATPPVVALTPPENLLHPASSDGPLFTSKVWLWIAMGAVILVLGYFTFSMMKTRT